MEKWKKYEFQRAPKSATTIDAGYSVVVPKLTPKNATTKRWDWITYHRWNSVSLETENGLRSTQRKRRSNICVHRCSVTVFSLHLISKMTAAKLEKKLLEPQEITSYSKIRLTVRWSALLTEPAKASFLMNSLSKQEIRSFPYESSCYLRC